MIKPMNTPNETTLSKATAIRLTSWQHVSERNGTTANLSLLTADGRLGDPVAKNIPRKLATEIRNAVNSYAALCAVAEALQDVMVWQKSFDDGECRFAEVLESRKDAIAALAALAQVRQGKGEA